MASVERRFKRKPDDKSKQTVSAFMVDGWATANSINCCLVEKGDGPSGWSPVSPEGHRSVRKVAGQSGRSSVSSKGPEGHRSVQKVRKVTGQSGRSPVSPEGYRSFRKGDDISGKLTASSESYRVLGRVDGGPRRPTVSSGSTELNVTMTLIEGQRGIPS
ncbi:hypothetical protein BV898_14460 [Hypsibius exemplaris]|uniref:Uncharacterized protein n=1 Tax=Hypsibius exemplaris TaxID=2072580 RepID=A0A9X6RJF9_HYPEX|nr:hypothetical protein BV898_14460 [Hypsibius exemplaris]